MKIEDLERIANHPTLSDHNLLVQGAKGRIKLYTIVKNDFDISYDLVEIHTCPDTGTEQVSYYEEKDCTSYHRGQTMELPIPAIEKLLLHNNLAGYNLNYAFPGLTAQHKIRSLFGIDAIELEDVYYDNSPTNKSPTARSPTTQQPHIRAIQAALKQLGTDATNLEIYDWIESECNSPQGANHAFFNYLDFEGDGIVHFKSANEGDTVLKNGNKPITKKNFQSIRSREQK